MDPMRYPLLGLAILITISIATIPAHLGMTVPELELESSGSRVPHEQPARMLYQALDLYFVLFVLFSMTPFITFILWTIMMRIKMRTKRTDNGSSSKRTFPDLFNGNRNPKVTIVIPCYNEARHVGSAVTSAVRQSYEGNIEILVIDDGSSDMTWSIGRTLSSKFHNRTIRALHKVNGGKASALSFGILEATGSIILTTDGDSRLDREAVREVVKTFREYPDAGIVGGYVSIENTHSNFLTKLQEFEYLITQDMIRMNQSDDGSVLIAPGPVFGIRADLSRFFNPIDRTVVEDCDLTQSVLSTKLTTRSNDKARSHTNAPENIRDWLRQRKRWVYGQYQVWKENRWHLTSSPWAVFNYFTWVTTTLSALVFSTFLLMTLTMSIIGSTTYTFIGFIGIRTIIVLLLYFGTRGIIILSHKESRKNIAYLPLMPFYDLVLSFLASYLFLSYLTGLGARIGWGNRSGVVH